MNLKQRIVRGVSWNIIENISVTGMRTIIGVILARILSPDDFGLIAMTTIFFAFTDVLVNGGFGQAFIQKKDATLVDAQTIFFINFFTGFFIYWIFWFSAPIISIFFNQPLLSKMIRVMSLIIIINSFNVIQLAILRKELCFKRKAVITFSSTFISGAVGVMCAFSGYGVWSLVIQQILNRSLIALGLFIGSSWRLRFSFSIQSFKKLFNVGAWLLSSNLLAVTFNNLYRLVIGKLYPVFELGLYDRSQLFSGLISQQLSWSANMVALPLFSIQQSDSRVLNRVSFLFLKYLVFISYPLLVTLFVVAKPFILFILTQKWIAMLHYLQLLCIAGLLLPLYDVNQQLFQSLGKAKAIFFVDAVKGSLRIFNVFVNYRYGVKYIIIGEIIVSIIIYILLIIISKHQLGFSLISQVFEIRWIVLSSISAGLLGSIIMPSLGSVSIKLFATSLLIIIFYVFLMHLLEKEFLYDVYRTAKMAFSRSNSLKSI